MGRVEDIHLNRDSVLRLVMRGFLHGNSNLN